MIDHSQGVVYRNSVGLVLVGECLPTLERPSVWADLPFSYVFARIRAYLRYGEPEGGKPSALYQNPGTISRFEKTMDLGPGAWGGPRAFGRGVNPSLNLSSGTPPLATDWSLLASPLPILSRSRLL